MKSTTTRLLITLFTMGAVSACQTTGTARKASMGHPAVADNPIVVSEGPTAAKSPAASEPVISDAPSSTPPANFRSSQAAPIIVSDGPKDTASAPKTYAPVVSDGPKEIPAPPKAAAPTPPPSNDSKTPAHDSAASAFTRFPIYSAIQPRNTHYTPSGYMGDSDLRMSGAYTQTHNGQGPALRVYYGASGQDGWAGIYWQDPANNWGTVPGRAGYDLRGAKKLTFWARGEKGGEKIHEFRVGGIVGKYPDSDVASIGPIRLSTEWKQYTIDLRKCDLRHVIAGFGFFVNKYDNAGGSTFYLDDIEFQGEGDVSQAVAVEAKKAEPLEPMMEETTLPTVVPTPVPAPAPAAPVAASTPTAPAAADMAIPKTFHESKNVHVQSTVTGLKVSFSSQVLFSPGRATLSAASSRILDETIPLLSAYPTNALLIEGYTDNLGGSEKNMTLSRLRAASVRDYLAKQGYDPTRFKIVGFGDTKPIADNSTMEGRAQNRRVEITILKDAPAQ